LDRIILQIFNYLSTNVDIVLEDEVVKSSVNTVYEMFSKSFVLFIILWPIQMGNGIFLLIPTNIKLFLN